MASRELKSFTLYEISFFFFFFSFTRHESFSSGVKSSSFIRAVRKYHLSEILRNNFLFENFCPAFYAFNDFHCPQASKLWFRVFFFYDKFHGQVIVIFNRRDVTKSFWLATVDESPRAVIFMQIYNLQNIKEIVVLAKCYNEHCTLNILHVFSSYYKFPRNA